MNLRTEAIAKLREYEAESAKRDAHHRKSLEPYARKECQELFGREPDSIDGCEVVVDGITMRLRSCYSPDAGRNYKVSSLEVHCPDCQDVFYAEFDGFADLGRLLENPPTHGYQCPSAQNKASDSVADRLADILREILGDR